MTVDEIPSLYRNENTLNGVFIKHKKFIKILGTDWLQHLPLTYPKLKKKYRKIIANCKLLLRAYQQLPRPIIREVIVVLAKTIMFPSSWVNYNHKSKKNTNLIEFEINEIAELLNIKHLKWNLIIMYMQTWWVVLNL